MGIRKLLQLALVLALLSGPAGADSDVEQAARGKAMAAAMNEYLMAFHMCQRYTGKAQYIAARSIATNVYEKISGDRNEAVLGIDAIERTIKGLRGDERLEAQFNSDQLPHADRVDFCLDVTEESKRKFEVEQAKNGLL